MAQGQSPDDEERLWHASEHLLFSKNQSASAGPLGVPPQDFARSIGLADFRFPVALAAVMAAPIRRRRERLGRIYVGCDEPGRMFTRVDSVILGLFAAQATHVIANARWYRDGQLARADVETLIVTCPVRVVVFDATTGAPTFVNREIRRITDGLLAPGPDSDGPLGGADHPPGRRAGALRV